MEKHRSRQSNPKDYFELIGKMSPGKVRTLFAQTSHRTLETVAKVVKSTSGRDGPSAVPIKKGIVLLNNHFKDERIFKKLFYGGIATIAHFPAEGDLTFKQEKLDYFLEHGLGIQNLDAKKLTKTVSKGYYYLDKNHLMAHDWETDKNWKVY